MWIIYIDTKTLNWCMSSRREVCIRILALLQRKTLIEMKNRTLKCLKRRYSTVPSMKKVAMLTEDGAFALFFRPHPRAFDSSRVPTPANLPSKANKMIMPGGQPGGGGGGGCWAQLESNWLMHYLRDPGNDINRFRLHRVITRHGRR